mmetsp:Transcript_2528/g.4762  ORF Transcript_2528/g.4762 Transcript_2528/m.4762 type:complete len:273 (+) Transcript_2528:232-1050(+)
MNGLDNNSTLFNRHGINPTNNGTDVLSNLGVIVEVQQDILVLINDFLRNLVTKERSVLEIQLQQLFVVLVAFVAYQILQLNKEQRSVEPIFMVSNGFKFRFDSVRIVVLDLQVFGTVKEPMLSTRKHVGRQREFFQDLSRCQRNLDVTTKIIAVSQQAVDFFLSNDEVIFESMAIATTQFIDEQLDTVLEDVQFGICHGHHWEVFRIGRRQMFHHVFHPKVGETTRNQSQHHHYQKGNGGTLTKATTRHLATARGGLCCSVQSFVVAIIVAI